MKILRKTILPHPIMPPASCQPRSQCPLRTLGTRLASYLNKLPPPLSVAPPANAAPNSEEAEWARFLGR